MTEQDINKIIGKNITKYLEKFGKSQFDLADYMNVSQASVSNWAKGIKTPRMDKIDKICSYFNITRSMLMEDTDGKVSIKAVQIPVLGRVQAGIPIDAQQEIIDWEEISPGMATRGEYFGLQVKGDSMEPKFSEHDVVIVRQQSDAESGSIVIALVNGYEATIKKLIKYEDGGIALIALNPVYQPLRFTEEEIISKPVEIVGRVVELRAKF